MGTGAKRQRRYGKFSKRRMPVHTIDDTNKNPPKKVLSLPSGVQMNRFVFADVASQTPINRTKLLNMMTFGVDGTATGRRLYFAIKIVRIKLYGPPGVSGVTGTHAVEWLGDTSGSRVTDDSNVANTASYISTKPPKGSYSDQWIAQGVNETTVAFLLSATVSSVLDIYYIPTISCESGTAHSTCITTANQTAGSVYYNNLDGTTANIRAVAAVNRIT